MRIAGSPSAVLLGLALAAASTVAHPAPSSYWTFSLSWSPEYCKQNPTSHEPQCGEENYFVVDALASRSDGGPSPACRKDEPVPRELVDRLMPVMRNQAAIQRTWKKQGACSGIPMKEYFLQLERAARRIVIPAPYRGSMDDVKTGAGAIREAFAEANPGLPAGGVLPECKGKYLHHVTLCLDANFEFRECGFSLPASCGDDTRLRSQASRFMPQR